MSTADPRKLAYHLRNQIEVLGGGMFTICPRYDRLNEPALCLEIKNLDLRCLGSEKLGELVEMVDELLVKVEK